METYCERNTERSGSLSCMQDERKLIGANPTVQFNQEQSDCYT